MRRAVRGGFTLVELLVVITIIAILIALLLPAVQTAREAGRVAQCQNHLHQLAIGCLNHESQIGRFPTGGWGFAWTGDPDRGTDWHQPGGWLFNILPYIEQDPLYKMGAGMNLSNAAQKQIKYDAAAQRVATPISFFNCPTRRAPLLYPWISANPSSPYYWFGFQPGGMNFTRGYLVARSDYAGNGGDFWTYANWPHPIQNPFGGPNPTVNTTGGYTYIDGPASHDAQTVMAQKGFTTSWPGGILGPASASGISFACSMISAADVTDGLSNTYMLGEKYLWSDHYDDGYDGGDDEWALQGYDTDNYRFACDYTTCYDSAGRKCSLYTANQQIKEGPYQDVPGWPASLSFGAAHSSGCNMAMCDGSVRIVSYSIDPTIHGYLSNRKDGRRIDAKAF